MEEENQYQNWSKEELIQEIMRLKKGRSVNFKEPEKNKETKDSPKKIEKKEKNYQKTGEEKIIFTKEKLEQLNKWFQNAKIEQPKKITNLQEFKATLKKYKIKEVDLKKETSAQTKSSFSGLSKEKPKSKLSVQKSEQKRSEEDKIMEKIRKNLDKPFLAPAKNKSQPVSLFKKGLGLLNEEILELKEEQRIRKIEKLKIKCRYNALINEYKSLINKTLKDFDARYPLPKELKNTTNDLFDNKSPNLQRLTDSQKEKISKFIKERNENIRKVAGSWFKISGKRFNLTQEEFSLLAQLINKDFPYDYK